MIPVESGEALVVLNVPSTLEEVVVDWLLSRANGTGFTSSPVSGHSTSHEHLSAAEQVSGRQRRLQFQVQMPVSAVPAFLDSAGKSIGAAGVHYWVVPLLGAGHLTQT